MNRRELLQGFGGVAALLAGAAVRAVPTEALPGEPVDPSSLRMLSDGLKGPEGPSVLPDGSVVVAEFLEGNLWRVDGRGGRELLASPGSGVAGTAIGRDGSLYVVRLDMDLFKTRYAPRPATTGTLADAADGAAKAATGALLRIDLLEGSTRTLSGSTTTAALQGPDDLVIDRWGDIWFTDLIEKAVYWCRADGGETRRVLAGCDGVNGIALSPDLRRLHIVGNGKMLAVPIIGRGTLGATGPGRGFDGAPLLPNTHLPDGMKTEANGNVLCACWEDGLVCYAPDGQALSQTRIGNLRIINMVFGGPDMRTLFMAVIPPSGMLGGLASIRWPRPGLPLAGAGLHGVDRHAQRIGT